MKLRQLIALCLIALVFLSGEPSVFAQEEANGVNIAIKAGYDGYAKSNTWTPVSISASNSGPDVKGQIRLTTDYPGETYSQNLTLPSQSQKEITLYIILRGGEFTAEFVSDDGEILHSSKHSPRSVSPYGILTGVVSNDPSLLNFLSGFQTQNSGENVEVAHLLPADIPEQTAALSAFNILIFNDVDTAQLTPNQQQALKEWVKLGGQLIIGGGPNAALTLSGLSELVPGKDFSVETLNSLNNLENYAGEPVPNQGPYLAAIPGQTEGYIDLYEQGQPMLISKPLGHGSVSYFGLDFNLAPMNGWAGNEAFWRKLLNPLEGEPVYYATYNGPQTINDSLANIAVAGLPSPLSLISFLCLYMLILIPANYFILKRMKRLELAWITIPVLIILFSLVGYIGGFRARGGEAILKQISIIWQTSGESQATVDSFIGLYSPTRQNYTLQFEDDLLVQPTESGNGFKGIKQTSSAPSTINYASQTEFQNLWTDVGSMSTILAHSNAQVEPIELKAGLIKEGNKWKVSGVINNNSGKELSNPILLINNYGVQLPPIKPGQTILNHTLQQIDQQPYGNVTLWGESYYQLSDPEERVNDQMIRNIFWPEGPVNRTLQRVDGNLTGQVHLVGWQKNTTPPILVKVLNQKVDHDASNLIIVTSQLGGL